MLKNRSEPDPDTAPHPSSDKPVVCAAVHMSGMSAWLKSKRSSMSTVPSWGSAGGAMGCATRTRFHWLCFFVSSWSAPK